jgi:glycerol-3-phosphate acyltransferase PlsY
MSWTLALLISFVVGGIPWSWLAGRLIGGLDLRRVGSGNLGATNTFRALGAKVAIPVLLLDVFKGVAAVLLIAPRCTDWGALSTATGATLCGLAAILGHMFPPYLGFRGGKGIATSAGVFAALEPLAFVLALAVFGLAFAASGGIVSVGSLLGSLSLPAAIYGVGAWRGDVDWTRLGLVLALVVVVWVKHAANIGRLLQRSERGLFDGRGAQRR